MTKDEAIYLLRNTAWLAPSLEPVEEAVEMATEALKAVAEMSLYPPKHNEICINGNGAVLMCLETLYDLCQDDSPLRKQIRDKHQVEYVIAKGIRERREE